jgi:hypothetical protein
MSQDENIDDELADLGPDRRRFIKRMAIGAVGAPLIASFSMDAISAAPAYAAPNSSI